MASRRESRQRALQMLFLWDQTRLPAENVITGYWNNLVSEDRPVPADDFANELLCGALRRLPESDSLISAHAEHWRLERMSTVDRNILRLGVYELLEKQTPAAVVIDEALEIARRFSTDESVQFINGVLDAVRRAL